MGSTFSLWKSARSSIRCAFSFFRNECRYFAKHLQVLSWIFAGFLVSDVDPSQNSS